MVGQLDERSRRIWYHIPHRSIRRINAPRRRSPHPLPYLPRSSLHSLTCSCLPRSNLPFTSNSPKQHHRLRQEHHIPQTHRLVHSILQLGPHHRSLGKLCPLRHRHKNRNQRISLSKLPYWSRRHWLRNAHSINGHGIHRCRKTPSRKLREVLVHTPLILGILLRMEFPRRILYDPTRHPPLLFRHRRLLEILVSRRVSLPLRAPHARSPRYP